MTSYFPSDGLSDQRFHLFIASGATHVGEPVDHGESEHVAWVPMDELGVLIRSGEVTDGLSLVAILWVLQFSDVL